jgi:hypothetical protein
MDPVVAHTVSKIRAGFVLELIDPDPAAVLEVLHDQFYFRIGLKNQASFHGFVCVEKNFFLFFMKNFT